MAGLLVVAGLALAFILANRIVEPLRKLTATTARIAGGDLNAKVEVNSHDEVGMLATEYNRMAERIRQLRRSDMGQLVVGQQTTEAAIDSLYDPVIVTDAEGRLTKLNPAAEEIFGSEKQNRGRHVGEIARDTLIAGAVAEALRSQRPVAGEGASSVLPLAVDGSERAFRLRTTPMRDEEKQLLGAVILLEDITHLREIDRLKSEFIATASHELRTPLTSVQMSVYLLLEGAVGELTDRQQEVLEACRQDCERLDKLMRDLLDLSRIEAGESQPQSTPVRARELIEQAVEELRPQVETKGMSLSVELAVDLPPMMVDRAQIERVIMSTAYASIELAVDAMKLGATDFVRKPMTPDILRNAVAAALYKQQHVSESAASSAHDTPPARPRIQTLTINGFTILDSDVSGQTSLERRFIVKSPGGDEHEVLVQIDEEVIGYVERMTRRRLPPESSFWTTQAQRVLSSYLWREGKVPPTRTLTVKDVDRDELPVAARW